MILHNINMVRNVPRGIKLLVSTRPNPLARKYDHSTVLTLTQRTLPTWSNNYQGRQLPGQGAKKKTEEEILEEENKSSVVRWMNKQKEEQQRQKKKGSRIPDKNFLLRFCIKTFVCVGLISVTYEEVTEYFKEDYKKGSFDIGILPEPSENIPTAIYRALPLRGVSRVFGRIMDIEFFHFVLTPMLKLYTKVFNIDMEEALVSDFSKYSTISQFFRRPLKPELRPIDTSVPLTSPCDGRVLHAGEVTSGVIEHVKHLNYSLPKFFGPIFFDPPNADPKELGEYHRNHRASSSPDSYHKVLLQNPDSKLCYCVIYLSPGDCHRFFSPVDWVMKHRRHFPGELVSVSPSVVKKIPGVFSMNERVNLSGNWKHGFFAMSAVGATNVGSIYVYDDLLLRTNRRHYTKGTFFDVTFADGKGYEIEKGEGIGEFNMGSTIVLIFEAPQDFKFDLEQGQVMRYGEPLMKREPEEKTEKKTEEKQPLTQASSFS